MITFLVLLAGCVKTSPPPLGLSERPAPLAPAAPQSCEAAYIVTRPRQICEAFDTCEVKGRLYTWDGSLVPARQGVCSYFQEPGDALGYWLYEIHDRELRGELMCMAQGGAWQPIALVAPSARPSPSVYAVYGKGALQLEWDRESPPTMSLSRACNPPGEDGSSWKAPPAQ